MNHLNSSLNGPDFGFQYSYVDFTKRELFMSKLVQFLLVCEARPFQTKEIFSFLYKMVWVSGKLKNQTGNMMLKEH
jgi:hypothetical protein